LNSGVFSSAVKVLTERIKKYTSKCEEIKYNTGKKGTSERNSNKNGNKGDMSIKNAKVCSEK
jgi:hypothetical protein